MDEKQSARPIEKKPPNGIQDTKPPIESVIEWGPEEKDGTGPLLEKRREKVSEKDMLTFAKQILFWIFFVFIIFCFFYIYSLFYADEQSGAILKFLTQYKDATIPIATLILGFYFGRKK